MQTQPNEERQEAQPQTKPRFRIEKLEERIAPSHKFGHCPGGQQSEGTWGCVKPGGGPHRLDGVDG